MWVYSSVVDRSAWPSISWTLRRSAPPSSRCVANECRSRCGWIARRVEAGLGGEAPQDQERSGAGERAALRVQEELGPVARVEVRAAAGEVAPQRLDGRASERDDALLVALAGDADEAVVEVDARLVEADRLGDAEAGAVEQLDQRPVAQRARRRAGRGLDQPLDLAGRQRARQGARPPRQRQRRRRVVAARFPSSCSCR